MLLVAVLCVLGTIFFLVLRRSRPEEPLPDMSTEGPAPGDPPPAAPTDVNPSPPLPFIAVRQHMTDINERDLFVALVGHVSAGKSSIFKRLLGLQASDVSVPVGERGGSTTSVQWDVLPRPRSARGRSVAEDQGPCRILADMPGVGQAEEPGVSLREVQDALEHGQRRVNMVLLVVSQTVNKYERKLIETARKLPLIKSCPERRILVLMTKCDNLALAQRQERREDIIRKLGVREDQVIECSAAAYDPSLTPGELRKRQKKDREFDPDLILQRLADELDRQQEAMLAENLAQAGIVNGGDLVAMGATGLATTVAVWLPGISAWGVLAGPALLTPVGWVALGPVIVVGGSVGAAFGIRKYMQARRGK